MLYFTKLRIFLIYIFICFICFFTVLNFIPSDIKPINKNINLGLDLQGGSYLLLEIDNRPVVLQKIQNKFLTLKKKLIENNINYKNIKINSDKIVFDISLEYKEKFIDFFTSKESEFNNYYPKFNSYELDYTIEKNKVKELI